MAAFDFSSGARGAQAGSVAGPWGAVAGFVVGGFVGGRKAKKAKKKLKKKRRRYEKAFAELTSPEHFGKLVGKVRPVFREQMAGTFGPQVLSQLASGLARGGFTGTGVGETTRAVGQVAPEIAALNLAIGESRPIWEREIDFFQQKARNENIGWPGGPAYQPPDPFGSAGGLVNALGAMGGMGGGGGFGNLGFSGQGLMGGGGFRNPYLGQYPGRDQFDPIGQGFF